MTTPTTPTPPPINYAPPARGRRRRGNAPPRKPGETSAAAGVLLTVGWTGAAVFVIGLLAGLIRLGMPPVVAYASPLFSLAVLPTVAFAARALRRRRAGTALTYVEHAVRLNLPLPRLLYAAAAGERGVLRARLLRLLHLLETGEPLSDALESAVPETPPRTVSLVRAAEASGRLPRALARLARDTRLDLRRSSALSLYRWYPLVLLAMLAWVVALLAVYIFPKYRYILADFKVPLPPLTAATIEVADALAVPIFVVTTSCVALVSGRRLWEIFRRRAADLPGRALKDLLLWFFPPTRGLANDRGLGDVCRCLAEALAAGRPAHQALDDAAQIDMNRVLRARIRRWGRRLEDGQPLADAARAARLPPLLSGLLATAPASAPPAGNARETPGDLASDASGATQVLGFLARYYEARYQRRSLALQNAYVPLVVLVLALLVGCVAVALFQPLQSLVDAAAPYSGSL